MKNPLPRPLIGLCFLLLLVVQAPAFIGDPCSGSHADAFEPNDTFASAAPIAVGIHLNLFVADFDRDYYSLLVPSGDRMRVEVLSSNNALRFQVWRDGVSMAAQDGGVFVENFTLDAIEFFFRPFVLASNPDPCATYDLSVELEGSFCSPGVDDSFEPNDDCLSAVPLLSGIYLDLTSRRSDLDFYTLAVNPGDIVRVVELQDSGGEMVFRLRSQNCTTLLVPFGSTGFQYSYMGLTPTQLVLEAWVAPSNFGVRCTEYGFDLYVGPDVCVGAADDGFEDNDTCAQAAPGSNGVAVGLFVEKGDEDHFAYTVPDGGSLEVSLAFLHAAGNVDCRLWEASDPLCSVSGNGAALTHSSGASDGEALVWVNRSGASVQVVLEVRVHPTSFSACNTYDLDVRGHADSPPVGVVFCDPAVPNGVGTSTQLSGAMGQAQQGAGLHLEARYGAPGEFGYMLVSAAFQDPGIQIGNGQLCLSGSGTAPCCRYNVAGDERNSIGRFDGTGELQNLAGTSGVGSGFDVPVSLPLPGTPLIQTGETWHFQLWHRDGAGTSNFSNGLSVSF
ncbi:MAG: hypothetical protein JKY61_04480 [Planctomycetes bacterium]|nr:hypothetical protein [Planctomycetota bacterium]